jgi:hypothetical protein
MHAPAQGVLRWLSVPLHWPVGDLVKRNMQRNTQPY